MAQEITLGNTKVTAESPLGRLMLSTIVKQREALTNELNELGEIEALLINGGPAAVVNFPSRKPALATAVAATPPKARKRQKMTAAQRKAVGMRMKKYWAERRKNG